MLDPLFPHLWTLSAAFVLMQVKTGFDTPIFNYILPFFSKVEWYQLFTINTVNFFLKTQKQPFKGFLKKRRSKNMQQIYRRTPMLKCDFTKFVLQLYWNCTLALVFSCKFASYFQNTFLKEHQWRATSENNPLPVSYAMRIYWNNFFKFRFRDFCWLFLFFWFCNEKLCIYFWKKIYCLLETRSFI